MRRNLPGLSALRRRGCPEYGVAGSVHCRYVVCPRRMSPNDVIPVLEVGGSQSPIGVRNSSPGRGRHAVDKRPLCFSPGCARAPTGYAADSCRDRPMT
jgi:hypothetical protein